MQFDTISCEILLHSQLRMKRHPYLVVSSGRILEMLDSRPQLQTISQPCHNQGQTFHQNNVPYTQFSAFKCFHQSTHLQSIHPPHFNLNFVTLKLYRYLLPQRVQNLCLRIILYEETFSLF